MRLGSIRGPAVAALFLASSAVASADPPAPAPSAPTQEAADATAARGGQPDVATLLFGTPAWGKAGAGAKLHYTYDKATSDKALGAAFKDEVVLTLGAGDDAKSRTTEMQLFTGANRKPAGPFPSNEQNPLLLVALENNVQEFSTLFKANPRYLKNAIRKAWRDNPKIEQATSTIDGKQVAVTRIVVTPFVDDAEADRMKGLSGISYTVDVSNDVPGYIAAIDIRAPAQGQPLFAETLHYASETKP